MAAVCARPTTGTISTAWIIDRILALPVEATQRTVLDDMVEQRIELIMHRTPFHKRLWRLESRGVSDKRNTRNKAVERCTGTRKKGQMAQHHVTMAVKHT